MSSQSDRRAELERKKAKLQALREEKDRRRREKEMKDFEEASIRLQGPEKDNRRDIDEMLSSLGVAPVSDVLSSISSVNSLTPEQSMNHTPENSLQPNSNQVISAKKKITSLSIVSVQATNIPPKENATYTKQTQTVNTSHERDAHATDYYVLTFDDPERSLGQGEDDEGNSLPHIMHHSKLPPGILPHGLPMVQEVAPALTPGEQRERKEQEQQPQKEIRELSDDQKQMIILSEGFQRFMNRAGRLVERALSESLDIYTDYTGGADNNMDEKTNTARLSLNRWFFDERWTKGRCVTSLDWSSHYPELLLSSYHGNEDAPNDPEGVCVVWNTKFKKTTPEDVYFCQSAVMSATFARFHPNLIMGGTYSGQIVLWDNRVQKRTPIQRTPLSASAHTHPIYCLDVVGTQNAHNLISVSSDGRMCSWSLDMLSAPQDTQDLQQKQNKQVAATCMTFPTGEVNNFIVGSEEGTVYSACRHGDKAGVVDFYNGHQGPITGIAAHRAQNTPDMSHLFLTSSIDWTIKLWSLKDNKPLYSFEDNGDYVLDVSWSPIHPALFAAVDGSGRLDLWNLNQDTEVPTATIVVENQPALNRVSWTPSGLHVTVGDDNGKIWVYDVAEHLSLPRHDEWNRFSATLQELTINQQEDDLDKSKGL
uniref:Putative cytoplasmic dynein intermediate chain n=1 Tax=Xenopsylla cheopis TaxID=163159 RepID=A0A6M2DIL6_XENCH